MIFGIADPPTYAELLAEIEALRAENARLRGLSAWMPAPTIWPPLGGRQRCSRRIPPPPRRSRTLTGPRLDIAAAVDAGRNCLVLTRWTEHLDRIVDTLTGRGLEPLMLHGKMGKKARTAVIQQLAEPQPDGGLLLVATASLIGEGFDCPPLDTLFLAFPIKFKGNVVQYVGRVLRPTDTKTRVEVHDYVDSLVPVLARQHDERRTAYASLGFDIPRNRPHRH